MKINVGQPTEQVTVNSNPEEGKVIISSNPTKVKIFLDKNGNEIDPRTKQIINNNEDK